MPKFLLAIVISLFILVSPSQTVYAQTPDKLFCSDFITPVKVTGMTGQDLSIPVKFTPEAQKRIPSGTYRLLITDGKAIGATDAYADDITGVDGAEMLKRGENTLTFTIPGDRIKKPMNYTIRLKTPGLLDRNAPICDDLGTATINSQDFANLGADCSISFPDNIKYKDEIHGSVNIPDVSSVAFEFRIYKGKPPPDLPRKPGDSGNFRVRNTPAFPATGSLGTPNAKISGEFKTLHAGTNSIDITGNALNRLDFGDYTALLSAHIQSGDNPQAFYCALKEFSLNNTDTTEAKPGSTQTAPGANVTEALTFKATIKSCDANKEECTTSEPVPCPGGIMTAIGCVPTEPKALVEGLLRYGTLAAGGVAFLIMILASLEMITAEGNPESIKAGQEKFYSAIIGLLLIIFSVLLMQVIGVDILGLPGFGKQ